VVRLVTSAIVPITGKPEVMPTDLIRAITSGLADHPGLTSSVWRILHAQWRVLHIEAPPCEGSVLTPFVKEK